MILEYENDKDKHYYYVMAWIDEVYRDKPDMMQKFDIYDDAVKYFNSALRKIDFSGYVRLFEYIGGKRKLLATSEEGFI